VATLQASNIGATTQVYQQLSKKLRSPACHFPLQGRAVSGGYVGLVIVRMLNSLPKKVSNKFQK
jgi:hypothetical protein